MSGGKGEQWSVKTLVLHPCEPHRSQGEGTLPARPGGMRMDTVPGSLWKTSDFVVVWLIPPQQVTVCPRAHGLCSDAECIGTSWWLGLPETLLLF